MADAGAHIDGGAHAPTSPASVKPRERWTSLLQPGRHAHPLQPGDWLLVGLLYLAAFSFRWDLHAAQPYIAETWHYYTARHLWDSSSNVVIDSAGGRLDLSWFFWQRPFLALPFYPFASQSFEAYRAAHVVLASTVPALAAWLLRSMGIGRLAAGAAGVVLAVHPTLLPWGVMVLPDSMVLALLLAALIAAQHGRPLTTAILLWVATWVKEVAFVGALTLLVLACWRDVDGRRASVRPFHLGPFARWLLPVVPLAFLPLWVSMQVPGAIFPGFRPGGPDGAMLESLFLLVWLAPVPLLGLLRPATRRFVLVAMAWPAFFLVYSAVQGKAMEFWYYVIPASFTLLAAAAALDDWSRDLRGARRLPAPLLGLALLALVGVQVFAPIESGFKQDVVTPFTGRGQWDLAYAQGFELQRDGGFPELLALAGPHERDAWMAVDVEVSFLYYPVSDQAGLVYAAWSPPFHLDEAAVTWWQWAVENATGATLVSVQDHLAFNLAIRLAYQECSTFVWPYVLIQAEACQGAGADLWQHYRAAAGIPDGP